jgi:hypothetical protein
MTDDELRALVRESIAKQIGAPGRSTPRPDAPPLPEPRLHASHAIYMTLRTADDDACIIEPAVPCTHCHYCQSHGH